MNIPAEFSYINEHTAPITPNSVHVVNTTLAGYFRRYLLQKAISVFKWSLPDTWDEDYFKGVLYCTGRIAVFSTDTYGVIPQACGLGGYNIYYQPREALITNPLIERQKLLIGTDCAIIKLQPDWGGIMDLVNHYAGQMALIVSTYEQNTYNSKISYIFSASSKAAAESFKKMFDKISSGDPAVVIDKNLFNEDGSKAWDLFDAQVGSNYIGAKLLEDLKTVENRFCTAVGLPNSNVNKGAQVLTPEVDANNVETAALANLWLDTIQRGVKQVKDMFGVDVGVDWRVKPAELQEVEE